MGKQKTRKKKPRPYGAVKFEYVQVANPFRDMSIEERQAIFREASVDARTAFEADYPKIAEWFTSYDALYLLSYCVLYFLSSPAGIDREVVDGKLDFASFHLELLQAFALRLPRCETPRQLAERSDELHAHLGNISESLKFADLDFSSDPSGDEFRKLVVLHQMRDQTFAVRHWVYPEQMLAHLRSFWSGQLSEIIAAEYPGISIVPLIDAMSRVAKQIEDQMNKHIGAMAALWSSRTFDDVCQKYETAFPEAGYKPDQLQYLFFGPCGSDLVQLKSLLCSTLDQRLAKAFSFTIDDVVRSYDGECSRENLRRILRMWSLGFGELKDSNPMYFLYANPVLRQPLIQLTEESFFWALSGIYTHTLPSMLDLLVPAQNVARYSVLRSKYLENRVAELFRQHFHRAKVYQGSQYHLAPEDTSGHENDLLVIVDTTAFVIECKSGRVDPPARRGAELSLADTFDDLIAAASTQAQRFTRFLKSNPKRLSFQTRAGHVNSVDASRLLRFIPLSVTYEHLGFMSANLKNLAQAGFISEEAACTPSLCFTDLEVIFEILDSAAQRIHYLARRAEIENTMNYWGDEIDLLALYVESGFNIGDWETSGDFLNICMKSKELDPYYVGRADGVSVPKPSLRLTDWWRRILARIEKVRMPCWTEIAYVLLNIGYKDQITFDQQTRELMRRVKMGKARNKYNWCAMLSGTNCKRPYGLVGFLDSGFRPEERTRMMRAAADEFLGKQKVFGLVILAVDMTARLATPYAALGYVPGNADGAIDVGRMIALNPPANDFDLHLKNPRRQKPLPI